MLIKQGFCNTLNDRLRLIDNHHAGNYRYPPKYWHNCLYTDYFVIVRIIKDSYDYSFGMDSDLLLERGECYGGSVMGIDPVLPLIPFDIYKKKILGYFPKGSNQYYQRYGEWEIEDVKVFSDWLEEQGSDLCEYFRKLIQIEQSA